MKTRLTVTTDIGDLPMVDYHGSLRMAWGVWVQLWECACAECERNAASDNFDDIRWVLVPAGSRCWDDRLEHVRPESFDHIYADDAPNSCKCGKSFATPIDVVTHVRREHTS